MKAAGLNDLAEQLSRAQQVPLAYELVNGDGSYSLGQRGRGVLGCLRGNFE